MWNRFTDYLVSANASNYPVTLIPCPQQWWDAMPITYIGNTEKLGKQHHFTALFVSAKVGSIAVMHTVVKMPWCQHHDGNIMPIVYIGTNQIQMSSYQITTSLTFRWQWQPCHKTDASNGAVVLIPGCQEWWCCHAYHLHRSNITTG